MVSVANVVDDSVDAPVPPAPLELSVVEALESVELALLSLAELALPSVLALALLVTLDVALLSAELVLVPLAAAFDAPPVLVADDEEGPPPVVVVASTPEVDVFPDSSPPHAVHSVRRTSGQLDMRAMNDIFMRA